MIVHKPVMPNTRSIRVMGVFIVRSQHLAVYHDGWFLVAKREAMSSRMIGVG